MVKRDPFKLLGDLQLARGWSLVTHWIPGLLYTKSYWLFNSDPYNSLLYSLYNWVVHHPLYSTNRVLRFLHCSISFTANSGEFAPISPRGVREADQYFGGSQGPGFQAVERKHPVAMCFSRRLQKWTARPKTLWASEILEKTGNQAAFSTQLIFFCSLGRGVFSLHDILFVSNIFSFHGIFVFKPLDITGTAAATARKLWRWRWGKGAKALTVVADVRKTRSRLRFNILGCPVMWVNG